MIMEPQLVPASMHTPKMIFFAWTPVQHANALAQPKIFRSVVCQSFTVQFQVEPLRMADQAMFLLFPASTESRLLKLGKQNAMYGSGLQAQATSSRAAMLMSAG